MADVCFSASVDIPFIYRFLQLQNSKEFKTVVLYFSFLSLRIRMIHYCIWYTQKINNSLQRSIVLYKSRLIQNQQCGCAPSEDSDQPGPPPGLIRVFAVRMKKAWVLSYPMSAQRRLWSDRADAQADLSLRWAHTHFVGFVTRRLIICWLFTDMISYNYSPCGAKYTERL